MERSEPSLKVNVIDDSMDAFKAAPSHMIMVAVELSQAILLKDNITSPVK